jgi:hypothetical protein
MLEPTIKQQGTPEKTASSGGCGTAAQARENLYKTLECIEWGDDKMTINDANALFQAYFAEGSTKADELQELITEAKTKIREDNPDKEVSE